MNMPVLTIIYGALLIILGLAGYFGTDTTSPTPLIPVAMGIILLALGLLAYRGGNLRKYALQLATVLSILGFLGTLPGLWNLFRAAMGVPPSITMTATIYRSIMALLSLAYFIYAFKAFMNAKRIERIDTDDDIPT
jgi:sulfite exporter TauE/SafE